MAIYHNTGKVINRTSGRSPIAASAYINGAKMKNEYDGLTHDYSKKWEVVYREVMLCKNAPQEYKDNETLWNAVIKKEGQTGQRARTFEVALPIELDRKEQIRLVQDYVRDNFVNSGMCADFAIHDKKDGNPHAHIMLTMRPIDENGKWENKTAKVFLCKNKQGEERGFISSELEAANTTGGEWEKQLPYFKNGNGKAVYLTKYEAETDNKYKDYVRVSGKKDPKKSKEDRLNPTVKQWNSAETFEKWKEDWAVKINRELEKKNLPQRVDHRSYEAQGIDKIPTKHIGVSTSAIERKGISTERGKENREIKKANAEIEILKTQIQQTQKEIISVREGIATATPDKKEAVKINDTLYSEYIKAYPEVNAQKLRNVMHEEAEKGNVYFLAKVDGQFRERIVTLEQYRQMEKELQQRTEAIPKPAEPPRPQPESQPPARTETVKEKEPPRMAQEPSQPTATQERITFDTSSVARQLAELQNKYVRETVRSQERTEQPPQVDYTKDISEIKDLTRTISDFDRSLEAMKKEHDSLGRFGHGKDKKKLQEDIADFTKRREDKLELLKAYGISDPSKADEVISEKTRLAAAERYKAQAAKLNEGAGSKAAEAKAALLELAKTVPADQQQAVRSQMVQYVDDSAQDWAHRNAIFDIREQLNEAFKDRAESREQERAKTQGIEHDR